MGKYFENTSIVYLDQFAVSNLVDDEKWAEIRDLLIYGVEQKVILVPYTVEHLLESSVRSEDKAKKTDSFLFRLSGQFAMAREPILTASFLLFAIRDIPVNYLIFARTVDAPILNELSIQKYKDLNSTFRKMTEEATAVVNQFRDMVRDGRRANAKMLKALVQKKRQEYLEDLLTRFKSFAETGHYQRCPIEFSMTTIPYWADMVFDAMIVGGLTQTEAKQCIQLLSKRRLEIVPPVLIRASLEAMLAYKNQREMSADYLDIQRLSNALPFSDIMVIDKSKVYDLRTLGLDKKYTTSLFSGSSNDRMLLKTALSEITTGPQCSAND